MSTLSKKFEKFVGQTVKHPNRASCDMCDTTLALDDLAMDEDLSLTFTIAGQPTSDIKPLFAEDILVVNLEKNDDGQLIIDGFELVLE